MSFATNSFKYALGDKDSVEIEIKILEQENSIVLWFKDSGPGFPEKMLKGDFTQTRIGYSLIQGIVRKNLRGTLQLKNDNGAIVIITFKL